ncbi:hypothetical protein BJ165DRAFT_1524066 [Panaeolus papilionaceus]|nr:hypothetical protein BJ165DRAFT_1524066 [Panaeolus papilionaceus]
MPPNATPQASLLEATDRCDTKQMRFTDYQKANTENPERNFDAPTTLGSALKEEHHEVAPFTTDANVTDIDMNNASEEEMKELESLVGAESVEVTFEVLEEKDVNTQGSCFRFWFTICCRRYIFSGSFCHSVAATASVVSLVPAVVSVSTSPTVSSSLVVSPVTSAVDTVSLAVAAGVTGARYMRISYVTSLQSESRTFGITVHK